MKKLYVLFAACSSLLAQAQNFDWAKREGLWAYDYGYGITTDNSGNVYVAGKYEEVNANFSGTLIPCAGNHDSYLAKYTPSGALSWIRTSGGITGDYATGVVTDGSNYVYIAGEIEGQNETIYFPGSSITLVCEGLNDIFLAKYDLSGTLQWARRAGGIDYEKALAITYDPAGNVYICGFYRGQATFGGTTVVNNAGNNDIFVAKYDASGTFLWVQNAGGSGRDEPKSMVCDAAGNVYICGLYSSGCAFGSTTLNTTGTLGFYDAFIAKYSPTGSLTWVKTAGGDYDDVAWSITMDNAGKLFIAGEFNGYATFDALSLTTSGNTQAFVARYNNAGNAEWAIQAGGTNSTAANNLVTRARGIGTDGNNLYITGQFGATATFGGYTLTAVDSSDIFFAGLTNSGNFLAASAVGGPADAFEDLGYESGNAICADASGNVYATGSLLDGGVFGSTTYGAYSRTDVFVTKISQLTSVNDAVSTHNISVYPNPGNGTFTFDLSTLSGQKTELTIYNSLGQVINTRTDKPAASILVDLSSEEKGIYFVEIKGEGQSVSRGKIVLQ